jgi:hypothetical protein
MTAIQQPAQNRIPMKKIENTTAGSGEANLGGAFSKKDVSLEDVLVMFVHLGKLLQGVPKGSRQLSVSRVLKESEKLREEGHSQQALMLLTFALSWEDFGQGDDRVAAALAMLSKK